MPLAGNGVSQQVPRMSTTIAEPPHTPHASTVPGFVALPQQLPFASTLTPVPQQRPVMASIELPQHDPVTSVKPDVMFAVVHRLPNVGIGLVSVQPAPDQPCAHEH